MKTYEDDLTASKEEEKKKKKSMSSLHILAEVASMLYGELQRTKKEEDEEQVYIEEEDEEERIFVTSRSNLNVSLLPSSSSSLLRRDNKIQENPPNPIPKPSSSSCLTRKSSKKRVLQERKQSCVTKKAKVSPSYSWIGRETPNWVTHLMQELKQRDKRRRRTHLEEDPRDLKLIYERRLFKTDVNRGESRLSMPYNNLIDKDFLTKVELGIIEADIESGNKTGVGALLFDESFDMWGVMLKRWETPNKESESWNYTLTCGWNEIVESNGLKQGDDVSVWCFRWRGVLCFALVRPPL
ncbi:unnamed protein product [Cochlearia groenlandica]